MAVPVFKRTSKVLLIYTGGTIGMGKNPTTGALEPLDFNHLIDKLPEFEYLQTGIDVHQFASPIDSSDMAPRLWAHLVSIIADNYHRYDGFVILHGTDTMAYTASALSFMLENLTKPVILTGSQLPLGQLRTDGKENLVTSIDLAASHHADGTPRVPAGGIYSGYELVENAARPGAEEQINNEKYEFKARDYTPGEDNGIPHLLGNLNRIRRDHPALQRLRGLVINPTSNEKILSFTRFARPVSPTLAPSAPRDALVYLDLTPFGVNPRWDAGPILRVTDELSGQTFLWNESPYVSLDPRGQCAHILSVKAI